MTPAAARRQLADHLREHHAADAARNPRTMRGNITTLASAHRLWHWRYGSRSHYHQAPGEAPNRGPGSRPAGWGSGGDVVLIDRAGAGRP